MRFITTRFGRKAPFSLVLVGDGRPKSAKVDLSPSSSTSLTWRQQWPFKPDIVLEGGNSLVAPGGGQTDLPEQMSLLTTAHMGSGRLLAAFGDTSAATAQAARMAAIVMAEYPPLWPETVRGLLVHSAGWTPVMQRAFAELSARRAVECRLRRYGWGVPDLAKALHSVRNSLVLTAQATIQPLERVEGKNRSKEMHLYPLPWPRQELLNLGAVPVVLRVTLSYFIEPCPGSTSK